MTARRLLLLAAPLALAAAAVLLPGGLRDHLPVLRWRAGAGGGPWPTIVRHDYAVRLAPPGRFAMAATLALEDVTSRRFALLLNRALRVRAARALDPDDGGAPLDVVVTHGLPAFTRFHGEGRVVHLALARVPNDGRVRLELDVAGAAEHGEDGPDWRGILLVDDDEARMCEQTIFYPQVPTAVEGPGVGRAPWRLLLEAPAAWEVYAPGAPVDAPRPPDVLGRPAGAAPSGARGTREAREGRETLDTVDTLDTLAARLGPPAPGTRRWAFASERAAHLSILAGNRRRTERAVGDTTFVVLLRDEHAALAEPFVEAAARIFEAFAARFGDPGPTRLGIVEIACRPSSSYNWFSEGVVAIDRQVLSDVVPIETLAHEVGHLWWGQRVSADGPAERALTEGLAEASAWWYLLGSGEPDLVARGHDAVAWARRTVAGLRAEHDDAPLAAVTFATPGYQALAYAKAPLAWHALAGTLGATAWDEALRAYAARADGRSARLDDLRAALEQVVGAPVPLPWIDHAGHLEVALEDVVETESGLQATLRTRVEGPMPARALVALEVLTDRGRRRVLARVDGQTTRVPLPLDAGESARVVTLDPEGGWPTPIRGVRVLRGSRIAACEPPLEASMPYALEHLTLTFEEPLVPLALEEYLGRRVVAGTHVPRVYGLRVEDDGRRWAFTFRPLGVARDYELDLSPLVDGFGGPPRPAVLRWRTTASDDRTPPRLVGAEPPPGATRVPLDLARVMLVFDEPMRESIGFRGADVRAFERNGWRYPDIDPAWSDDARRLVVALEGPLEPGTGYLLPLRGSHFADLSDNGLVDVDYRFTTAER